MDVKFKDTDLIESIILLFSDTMSLETFNKILSSAYVILNYYSLKFDR